MSETRRFGKETVELSNLDKVFFPGAGITKGDLVEYYRKVAPVMLPHVRNRALVMHRFPDGIEGEGFYQKEVPDSFPDWIETTTVKKEGGRQTLVVCNKAATLVYLANQGCITPHVWLSRIDRPDRPDMMIVDLDPPDGDDFATVRWAARHCRAVLQKHGMTARLKTTGSRGLHVVVARDRSKDFDAVRTRARALMDELADRHPDRLTTEVRKNKRRGRLFLDIARNAYAQTAVAPYAVRALPGAPVATPLEWEELGRVSARTYTIANIFRRLGQRDDPWKSTRL